MKYKAIAVGLDQNGHPVQCLGNDRTIINTWAEEIAAKHQVTVEVYELVETLRYTFYPAAE